MYGTAVYKESERAAARRRAATKAAAIDAQLSEGMIEVNLAALAREEVEGFVSKLVRIVSKVKVLKLLSRPRGAGLSTAYELAEENDARMAGREAPFNSAAHVHAVQLASAHVQHANIRLKLYGTLLDILLRSGVTELEIGMRLSPSGYAALGRGIAHSSTLRRLSFAGSHMGDAALEGLKDGLAASTSLEELDLTACDITNAGATIMGAIIKTGAKRRTGAGWEAGLRQYPDLSLAPNQARLRHYLTIRETAREVDDACGGLLHIELAENPALSDRGGISLRDALTFDRRLVLLSLRGCGLSRDIEPEFVSLMREHRALARVDLRACSGRGGKKMGILKLRKTVQPQELTATGFKGAPPPLSPALTMRSAPLWEVLEGDALEGGGRLLGLGMPGGGELGPSPWASPRGTGSAGTPRTLGMSMSIMSWGDEQLVRGPSTSGLRRSLPSPSGLHRTASARAAALAAAVGGATGMRDSRAGPAGGSSEGDRGADAAAMLSPGGGRRKQVMLQLVGQREGPSGTAAVFGPASSSGAGAAGGHYTSTSSPSSPGAAAGAAAAHVWEAEGAGGCLHNHSTPLPKRKPGQRGRTGVAAAGMPRTGRKPQGRKRARPPKGGPSLAPSPLKPQRVGVEAGAAGDDVATAMAEVVGLLRDLELAVSAAEYAASTRGGSPPQQQQQQQHYQQPQPSSSGQQLLASAVPAATPGHSLNPFSAPPSWAGAATLSGAWAAGGGDRPQAISAGGAAPPCAESSSPPRPRITIEVPPAVTTSSTSMGGGAPPTTTTQRVSLPAVDLSLQQQVLHARRGTPVAAVQPAWPVLGSQHVALLLAAGTITGAWAGGGSVGGALVAPSGTMLVPTRIQEDVSEQLSRWCNLCDDALAQGL